MRAVLFAVWVATIGAQGATTQEVTVLPVGDVAVWGPAPQLVEEVRIGVLMGPEEYSFGEIGGVAVLEDETIWVGDSQKHAVFVYDSNGEFVRQIGRSGEGPGEFKYPSNLRAAPNGNVFTWDTGLRRVSEFSPSGDFVRSFLPPTHMIGGEWEELEIDSAGSIYLIAMTSVRVEGSTVAERLLAMERVRRDQFWLKMDESGAVFDSVFVLPYQGEGSVDGVRTMTQLSPLGYRVSLRNDEYRIRLERDEASVTELVRPWIPVRYSSAERREKQRLERVMNGRNGVPVRTIPADKPPIRGFRVDSEGRIWVQLHAQGMLEEETEGEFTSRRAACAFFGTTTTECDLGATEWREPVRYDVVGPAGRFYGQVAFPNRRTQIVHARGRTVWVVEKGDFGEEYVVRYRVGPDDALPRLQPADAERHSHSAGNTVKAPSSAT